MRKRTQKISEKKQALYAKRAQIYTDPAICASSVIAAMHKGTDLDLGELANKMEAEQEKLKQGDLSPLEEMLFSQTYALQAFFQRASFHIGSTSTLAQLETYSHIALSAQAECRKTILALAELKNPKRATFIKEQNNALNVQVQPAALTQKNNPELQNELYKPEEHHHAPLDDRSPIETSSAHPKLATLEPIYRRKNPRRQSESGNERF